MHWLCMGKTNVVCIIVFSCWTCKILDPNILNSGQRWKLQWFSHTASASIFTQSSLEVQNSHCTVDCSSAALEAAAECQKSRGSTVKLGNKERFDKEQIGIKEPFPVTNLPYTS